MSGAEPIFKPLDEVMLADTRGEAGVIVDGPRRQSGSYHYQVMLGGRKRWFAEEALVPAGSPDRDLQSLAADGQWGPVEKLKRVLAVERIRSRSRSTLYAFRAERILFSAHQYRPLLKFLDAADRRLLIADEVGVGKTIEAGLILTEMEARQDMHRVLVVCPSRLRQKWQQELNRKFDKEFEILDGKDVARIAERAADGSGRPVRFQGIVSQQTMRRRDVLDPFLAAVPNVDLIIVDEAHHGRNPGTATTQMINELGGRTDAMLLLTATPVHLGSRDLLTLLQSLGLFESASPEAFQAALEGSEPILQAQAIAKTRRADRLNEIRDAVRKAVAAQGGSPDPLAAETLRQLEFDPPQTPREWIELDRQLEELHVLAPYITRTRKRDVIQDAPIRSAQTIRCAWSEQETAEYHSFIGRSLNEHGFPTAPLGFGQIQRARQAASCLPAAMAATAGEVPTDESIDFDDEDFADLTDEAEELQPRRTNPKVPTWTDTKFERLLEILRGIDEEEPYAKVLIFAYFRPTAAYLERELNARGYLSRRIAGDVPSTPRRPQTDLRAQRVEEFRTRPDVRILVSTEVGSEGLDFQFCHYLVNYDLPWNPMVVEQRIGRIDRFGQKSKKLGIYNLVVEGSIEDRILRRLYERIEIFKRSVGSIDVILGRVVRELRKSYFSATLTPAEIEEQMNRAEEIVERRRRQEEELAAEANRLLGHEDHVRDELSRIEKLGRFVTGDAILTVLRGFLERELGRPGIASEAPGIWSLPSDPRVMAAAQRATEPSVFHAFNQRVGREERIRFAVDGEVAFENPRVELVNVRHPLIAAATAALDQLQQDPLTRIASATLRVENDENPELPSDGVVHLVVRQLKVEGIRERQFFDIVARRVGDASFLAEEAAELLLHRVLARGEDWLGADDPPPISEAEWNEMLDEALRRRHRLDTREKSENEAVYLRQLAILRTDHDRRQRSIRQRIATLRERQRSESVIHMAESDLRNREAEFDRRRAELDARRSAHVSLELPIAVCAVRIVRRSREELEA